MKPFINKYNWEGINFPSEKGDWKRFEKNNVTIALFCMLKKKKYILLMFQKINRIVKKQVILLMIPNGKKRKAKSEGRWLYLAVKKLSEE